MPVWDLSLNGDEVQVRDSSAAAVAICAIQNLAAQGEVLAKVAGCKSQMLSVLCSETYPDRPPVCRGLLKQGQVGDGSGKAGNAYTSWGDYFFMQALGEELGLKVNWW